MNEVEAVRLLKTGDRSAVDSLYGIYAQPAIRTAYLITRNQTAAEDAVHEAFVKVIRNISSLRDVNLFRPWFYRIVVNAAKTLSRNRYRSVPLDVETHDKADMAAVLPDEAAISIEEVETLRSAVAELNDTHRIPVILKYFAGLSEMEIAETLGLPQGTVKSRLYHARKTLQERLEGTNNKAPAVSLSMRPIQASPGREE